MAAVAHWVGKLVAAVGFFFAGDGSPREESGAGAVATAPPPSPLAP